MLSEVPEFCDSGVLECWSYSIADLGLQIAKF
jgi:hypothetical protein